MIHCIDRQIIYINTDHTNEAFSGIKPRPNALVVWGDLLIFLLIISSRSTH